MAQVGEVGSASFAPPPPPPLLGDKNFFSTKAKVDDLFAAATPLLASKLQSSLIELRSKYDALHLKFYPESAHLVSSLLI
jgi:hypothetical protein